MLLIAAGELADGSEGRDGIPSIGFYSIISLIASQVCFRHMPAGPLKQSEDGGGRKLNGQRQSRRGKSDGVHEKKVLRCSCLNKTIYSIPILSLPDR